MFGVVRNTAELGRACVSNLPPVSAGVRGWHPAGQCKEGSAKCSRGTEVGGAIAAGGGQGGVTEGRPEPRYEERVVCQVGRQF